MRLLLALFLWAFGVNHAFAQNASRPLNILLLVADDLGYADLGCYGGDIETPNLDALAKAGLRFSRFHAAPMCAVTRAMLLSGNDNHIAGMGRQGIRTGYEGYEGYLTDRVAPMPALLREAGYHTYIAGKWHLGTKPEHNPAQKGFEHSFVMLEGAANHYNNKNLFSSTENSPYTEDGVKTDWKEGDYSTEVYTDKLISFIDRHKDDGKPFFAFAAYTSPHWPLQVPEKYEAKYRGRYDAGYEVLKKSRFESLKRAGMIPTDAVLPQSHPAILPWDSLSSAEQRKEARKMELYAGMVDNLDEHIGRLIQYLKSIGQYDNTLIVFMSDNGAAAEDFYYNENYGPHLQALFTDAYEDMGKPASFNSYGPQWAEAGSAPFRYYKGFTTEGGMIAPMIISGPMVKGRGEISHAFTTLMDIAPTAYALAQVKYPSLFNNKPVYALKGASLLPLLTGAKREVHGDDYVFGMEHGGYAMIKKGDWKIVNIERPFNIENFSLYNLKEGLDEQRDLKYEAPEKFRELLREWEQFYRNNKVRIPTPKQGEGL